MQNEIKKLDEQIAELTAKRNALLKGGKRWRAEAGEAYFVIAGHADGVYGYEEDCDDVDESLYRIGNYFRTKEEAQHAINRMIATQQLKDRIAELNAEQGWVADWSDESQEKYLPVYMHDNSELDGLSFDVSQTAPSEFYCSNETILTVIEEMPDQIKLWLGVA